MLENQLPSCENALIDPETTMTVNYSCFEPHTVYTNGGDATKNITITIADHCGGKTLVSVIRPNGDDLFDKELSSPGQVALTVPRSRGPCVL